MANCDFSKQFGMDAVSAFEEADSPSLTPWQAFELIGRRIVLIEALGERRKPGLGGTVRLVGKDVPGQPGWSFGVELKDDWESAEFFDLDDFFTYFKLEPEHEHQ